MEDQATIDYYRRYVGGLTDEQIDKDLELAINRAVDKGAFSVKTIFLDMDGVCADFVSSVCGMYGTDVDRLIRDWPADTYDITKVINKDYKQMWADIDACGKTFWSHMRAYPWFLPMYKALSEVAEVVFLSSPSWCPDCVEGKLIWLQHFFGESFRGYVFTNKKHLLAKPDTVLIDDNPKQCSEFMEAGGNAVLFPRAWNPRGHSDMPHVQIYRDLKGRFGLAIREP